VARDRGQSRCRLVRERRRRGRWTSERSQDRERRTLRSRKISLIRLRLQIEILRKNPKGNPDDYDEEDIKHMRKVRQSRRPFAGAESPASKTACLPCAVYNPSICQSFFLGRRLLCPSHCPGGSPQGAAQRGGARGQEEYSQSQKLGSRPSQGLSV